MALSTPTDIGNKGDAWRVTTAAGAFVAALAADVRVLKAYPAWCYARTAAARLVAQAPSPDKATEAMRDCYRALCDETARLLADVGVPPAWLPWAARAMLAVFEANRADDERDPEAPARFAIGAAIASGAPLGKRPTAEGAAIVRGVGWYYRAHVQHPPASIHALAAEYAAVERRHTDARSVVQNSIRQARALLDLVPADARITPET
jgi:hypothetical protein